MGKAHGGNTVSAVKALAGPIVESFGLELWSVRFVREGADWFLRIFIDKPGGVSIDDCERVSRAVDAPLEELDPIQQNYYLEICSPGLQRELFEEKHFQKYIGSDVLVKMIRPLEGLGREFSAVLNGHTKSSVTVTAKNGEEISISLKDTVYIRLDDL